MIEAGKGTLPGLPLSETVKDVSNPYFLPFVYMTAAHRSSGDEWSLLFDLSEGRYSAIAGIGERSRSYLDETLSIDFLLDLFDDDTDGEPKTFVPGLGNASLRLTPIHKPDLILARCPGELPLRCHAPLADAASDFRAGHFRSGLPESLIPDRLFSELRADIASRMAPFAVTYVLELGAMAESCSRVCGGIDASFFYLDALRFLSSALAHTGMVRSMPGQKALVAQFSPRARDAELLGRHIAASLRKALGANAAPSLGAFESIDLREPGSAKKLRLVLPEHA